MGQGREGHRRHGGVTGRSAVARHEPGRGLAPDTAIDGHWGDAEMQTVARILLTLAALGYGLGTVKADFNKTHATNSAWTPHARFHVVWQILSYSGIALIALYLIWANGPLAVE